MPTVKATLQADLELWGEEEVRPDESDREAQERLKGKLRDRMERDIPFDFDVFHKGVTFH